MKRILLAAAIGIAAALSGCAGVAVAPITIPTPAQLVTDFCPTVNADLKVIAASTLLTAQQKQVLNGVSGDPSQPGVIAINTAVCAAGGTISVTSLTQLNATAFPALIGLVSELPMLPNQPAILVGLQLAAPIVNQITAQVEAQVASANAAATVAASTAAVAVSASSPLAASAIQ